MTVIHFHYPCIFATVGVILLLCWNQAATVDLFREDQLPDDDFGFTVDSFLMWVIKVWSVILTYSAVPRAQTAQ